MPPFELYQRPTAGGGGGGGSMPTVTSFTPSSGKAGSLVTITGTNFIGVVAVTINNVSASFTVVSPTQITAIIPLAASTGLISVRVAAASGAQYTVQPSGLLTNSIVSRSYTASGFQPRHVAYSPSLNRVVVVGSNSSTTRVLTSDDEGTTWVARTAPAIAINWTSIAWSPTLNLFAAVGNLVSGTNIMTSPNGVTWTPRVESSGGLNLTSIAWSPELGRFVAVASNYFSSTWSYCYSDDGVTWTAPIATGSIAATGWTGIAWSPDLGVFCAVSTAGTNRIARSPTGINQWGSAINPQSNTYDAICWAPGVRGRLGEFLVVTATTSGQQLALSTDSLIWSNYAPVPQAIGSMRDVLFHPSGAFVGVSDGGTVFSSGDDYTWNALSGNLGASTGGGGVAATPNRVVAVLPVTNGGICTIDV